MVAASCQYRVAVLVISIATYLAAATYGEKLKTANYACPEIGIDNDSWENKETVVLAHILNFDQDDSTGVVRFQILEIIKKSPTTTTMMMMEQIGEETSAILGKDFTTRCHIPQEGSVVLHIVGDEMDWLITRIAIPTTKDRKYMFYIIVEVSHEKKITS